MGETIYRNPHILTGYSETGAKINPTDQITLSDILKNRARRTYKPKGVQSATQSSERVKTKIIIPSLV